MLYTNITIDRPEKCAQVHLLVLTLTSHSPPAQVVLCSSSSQHPYHLHQLSAMWSVAKSQPKQEIGTLLISSLINHKNAVIILIEVVDSRIN